MEKKKKKIKFSKKLIAASLLAVVLLVNFIYSSFEQVSAQGMFGSVEDKVEDIRSSTDKQLKVLEVLPDANSLSVLEMLIGIKSDRVGSYGFQDLLASYDSAQIEAFANTLSQYGIINLDSTSSAIYPLTYYKPGDDDRVYSNEPVLPEEKTGYALVDTQLAVGTFEVVDVESIKANFDTAETVYYQEIIVKETSPSTPSETSPSTPDDSDEELKENMPYYVNEKDEVVYLTYKEEGFNKEIYDGYAKEGRFFRFKADEVSDGVAALAETATTTYTGYGYRFVFGSKAEIKSNNLFTRFVLGITDDENTENGSEVAAFNKNNMYLKSVSIDALGAEDLSQFDLVYVANPFLCWDASESTIKQYDYANPALNETQKIGKYSQWVNLDLLGEEFRVDGAMESAAAKLLEGAVNETTPLKLIVDSSILNEYERAVSDNETIIEAVGTDESLSASIGSAEGYLEALYGSEIYKALLMLAQDDFDSQIRGICNAETTTTTNVTTYTLKDSSEEGSWAKISSEDLRKELYAKDDYGHYLCKFTKTSGHFVNKNLYFYNHRTSDYKSSSLTQNGLVVLQMANGDFRSIMTKDLLRLGFTDVVTAIEDENRRNAYLENEREYINAEEISVGMVIQYLLNYQGITIEIKKNTISVLEIQPCADFNYTYNDDGTQTSDQKKFIEKWIKYFADEDRYSDVTFTSMSIQEFIGKNEDLNATYDLIYIGSNIGMFPQQDGVRRFNDTSMKGLIYTHVGDLAGNGVHWNDGEKRNVLSRRDVKGLLDTDYTSSDRTAFKDVNSTDFKTRTTGNDLSTYKKRDLLNFLESGYPIIVDEALFTFGTDGKPNKINAYGETVSTVTLTPTPTGKVTPAVTGTVTIPATATPTPTNTPTPSPTPVVTKAKVYIRKDKSLNQFDTVYLYVWKASSGEKESAWPGVRCTYDGEHDGWHWYSTEIDNTVGYDSFIIAGFDGLNNPHQTGDNTFSTKGKEIVTINFNSLDSIDGNQSYVPNYAKTSINTNNNNTINTNSTANFVSSETVNASTSSDYYTVDNSSYMYQLLKVATALNGTVDVSKVTLDTMNYEDVIDDAIFFWDERTYKNLLVDKDSLTASDASSQMSEYLNETKVYINLTNRPKDYSYKTSALLGKPISTTTTADGKETVDVTYLEPDADGRYVLNYEFSISTLAGSLNEKDFDCQLFVDANFDGKFSENLENLDSVIIKNAATGEVISKKDGEDIYHLQEGVAYTLTRKLPKSFDGCINWKLQISQNGNDEVVAAESGYCAIPVSAKADDGSLLGTGEKQKIKILQITSGGDTTEYSTERKSEAGTHVNLQNALGAEGTTDYSKSWHNLLSNIPDFELDITTMSAEAVAALCKTHDQTYIKDVGGWPQAQGYDMIIVGFIDVFADVYIGGEQSTQYLSEALIQFGHAGKSILFTHDTTAWEADYQHIAMSAGDKNSTYLTAAVRDLCGNDQFGVVTRKKAKTTAGTSDSSAYIKEFFETPASTGSEYSEGSTEWKELLNLGKDMAFKPNSKQTKVVGETQASTYVNLRLANYEWNNSGGLGEKFAQYVKFLIPSGNGFDTNLSSEDWGSEKMDIGKVNDGAITKYPYALSDTIEVGSTHAQYWTVDIESDSNGDNESDLVVWYCINDRKASGFVDYYDKSPNDVRNNYYIYNKGNITYTGAGHTPFAGEEEIKLFINTMIAAYNAQLRVPEIYIVENGEPEAEDLETLIIPYDADVTPENVGSDFVNFASSGDSASDISGTMKVFFNVYDGNLAAVNKRLKIDEIFITDSKGTDNANYKDSTNKPLKGNTYTMSKDASGSTVSTTTNGVLPIYDAETDKLVEYNALVSGKSYYIKAPLNTIFANDYAIDLHITMHTIIGDGDNPQETQKATDKLTISRAEIFDLD